MFSYYLFWSYSLRVKPTDEEHTHAQSNASLLLDRSCFQDSWIVSLFLAKWNRWIKTPLLRPWLHSPLLSPFWIFFVLPCLLDLSSYIRPLWCHSLTSPSSLSTLLPTSWPMIIFLLCHLKKWTQFSKWACIIKSYETLLVGPVGCQMVLMRSRSGVRPHMGLLVFSLFNGFRLHLWLWPALFINVFKWSKRSMGGYVQNQSYCMCQNSHKVCFQWIFNSTNI